MCKAYCLGTLLILYAKMSKLRQKTLKSDLNFSITLLEMLKVSNLSKIGI